MLRNRKTRKAKCLTSLALVTLVVISLGQATVLANNPPARCTGYGNLHSISLTDWEAGLESWTVGTHHVANPDTFDTPDWAVTGSLPDNQSGLAVFAANLDAGCDVDNETGALTLDSPLIMIPIGTLVPRISIDHFFATEFGWDGGNFKISVNSDAFSLIPASAIEIGSYNSTLFPPVDGEGFAYNTNPLANQAAFTGPEKDQSTRSSRSWGQSQMSLLGIAAAGDTIQLRFDFGVDECRGDIGWFVDEVEFYSCEAELLPSDCGNAVIDSGEQCDDGNDFIDDGCSNSCQIEDGWQCTAPNPSGVVPDPGFESGTPNPSWIEVSTNFLSPICDVGRCGTSGGTGPAEGSYWGWLGGAYVYEEASLSQSVVIPSTETQLTFELEASQCDSASDYIEVLIDGTSVLRIDGSSSACGILGYSTQSANISDFADGGTHNIGFHAKTFSNNGDFTSFFIDNIAMPGNPSVCSLDSNMVFGDGFE